MLPRPLPDRRPRYPGAILVSSLVAALTALIVVALLAWQGMHELGTLSERRSALSSHGEAVVAYRQLVQDLIMHARTFAISGDEASLAASEAADRASVPALERFRSTGAAVGAPDRSEYLARGLDTAHARLVRIRIAGANAAAEARRLARTSDGPALVRDALAVLDSSRAFVEAEEAAVVARIDGLETRLTLWIPALAGLSLVLGIVAVLLLRAQAAARAEDLTRFRAIFDNTFQFIGLLSRDGVLLESNRRSLEFAGLREDDVIGKPFWATAWWATDPVASERVREAVTRAAQGEFVRFPVEIHARDGQRSTIDFSITPIRGQNGEISLLVPEGRDITDQLATKQALAEAEERWNFALVGSDLGVWDWNAQTNQVFYSDRWKSMLGYAPDEIGNGLDEWSSRIHPDDVDATMQALHDHLEGRTPFYAIILRMRAKDGTYREILDHGMLVSRGADGTPLRLVGTHQDITEQRKAEADARQLQAQLSALLRHSPVFISVLDREGRYLQVSQSVATALGRPATEIVGRRLEDLWPTEQTTLFRARLDQIARTGRGIEVDDVVQMNGREHRLRTAVFPMRDERGEAWGIGTVAIDVTEAHLARVKLEAALDENRVLQGMLSICAQCKHIRDADDNQWKPVESYVQSHSAAVFSHGLCPSCTSAFLRENGLEDPG